MQQPSLLIPAGLLVGMPEIQLLTSSNRMSRLLSLPHLLLGSRRGKGGPAQEASEQMAAPLPVDGFTWVIMPDEEVGRPPCPMVIIQDK